MGVGMGEAWRVGIDVGVGEAWTWSMGMEYVSRKLQYGILIG